MIELGDCLVEHGSPQSLWVSLDGVIIGDNLRNPRQFKLLLLFGCLPIVHFKILSES